MCYDNSEQPGTDCLISGSWLPQGQAEWSFMHFFFILKGVLILWGVSSYTLRAIVVERKSKKAVYVLRTDFKYS